MRTVVPISPKYNGWPKCATGITLPSRASVGFPCPVPISTPNPAGPAASCGRRCRGHSVSVSFALSSTGGDSGNTTVVNTAVFTTVDAVVDTAVDTTVNTSK